MKQGENKTILGRSVSVDMSTGEFDNDHRVFATIVSDEGGTLLCELEEDNRPDAKKHLLGLLKQARSSVDYHMGAQNMNTDAGKEHIAKFEVLLKEIDSVLE